MRLVTCEARESALTPRGCTRMDTKVSTLVNPVTFIPDLVQTGDRQPLRKGEQQRIFSTVWEHSVLPFLFLNNAYRTK